MDLKEKFLSAFSCHAVSQSVCSEENRELEQIQISRHMIDLSHFEPFR
jgi:hypothetical protein